MTEHWDNPGVIIRPPRLYLGALIVGIVVEFFHPTGLRDQLDETWVLLASAVLSTLGGGIMFAGVRQFINAGTNVPTNQPVNALVSSGLYRFSRNPIYVGMNLFYLGIALFAGAAWCFAFWPFLVVTMNYGIIAREEAYLERKFGENYRAYKQKTRRWF